MLVCVLAHRGRFRWSNCDPTPAHSRPGPADSTLGRGRGVHGHCSEENAMTLLPARGVKASLIPLLMVVGSCGGGGRSSAPPLAGCNSGTTQVLFWTSHTPPDTDSMAHMVAAFNKQSTTSCVKMVAVPGSETDIAKRTSEVRGGTGTDVYELDRSTGAERAAAGVLTDPSPFGAASQAGNYLDF